MRRFMLVFVLAGCAVEGDFSGAIDTPVLSAEKYQKEIAAIDRLLFTEAPLGQEGVGAAEKEIAGLAEQIEAVAADSKFLKVESLELQLLARKAGRLSPSGNGAALQNDWMRIRNNLFDDRAWFARSAADLEYAATVVNTPQAVPAEAAPAPAVLLVRDNPREILEGRWQVRSMEMNGKSTTDRELMHSIWEFDQPRIIVTDSDGNRTTFEFLRDGDLLQVSSKAEGSGWMLHEIDRAGLRLAFYDGFARKPESFKAAAASSGPPLVTLRLVPVR